VRVSPGLRPGGLYVGACSPAESGPTLPTMGRDMERQSRDRQTIRRMIHEAERRGGAGRRGPLKTHRRPARARMRAGLGAVEHQCRTLAVTASAATMMPAITRAATAAPVVWSVS